MSKAPMPDEATISVRSVGVVTLYANRRGTLMHSDGGRIRDKQTILAHCYIADKRRGENIPKYAPSRVKRMPKQAGAQLRI